MSRCFQPEIERDPQSDEKLIGTSLSEPQVFRATAAWAEAFLAWADGIALVETSGPFCTVPFVQPCEESSPQLHFLPTA